MDKKILMLCMNLKER